MKLVLMLFGFLLIVAGIFLIIDPEIIFDYLERNIENQFMYVSATAVRLILGIILIISANESKFPNIIKIIGFLFIFAAVIFLFIGLERFQELVSSILQIFQPFGRIVGLFSIAFGSFIIYAFSARKK